MKLVKCANGHFYDEEKFSTCPHCAGTPAIDDDNGKTVGLKDISYPTGNINGRPVGPTGNISDRPTEPLTDPKIVQGSVTVGKIPVVPTPDDEKTIPMWFKPNNDSDDERKTKPNLTGFKPVVGWLVCTEGKHKGQSFNLYHGKNFVGRNADMDVCLSADLSVSRNRHAILVYEPKERIFFAQPGESHELFYVNDSVVLSVVQLNARDVISIGESTLVFVPFCDKEFTW